MSEHSRRDFLGFSVPAAVALGAGLSSLKPALASAQGLANTRNYGAAKLALELDGQHSGWLESAEGGYATADVLTDSTQRKHIAGVKYEDIVLTCGTGMSKGFYDWIKASFDKRPMVKSGAIVAFDASGRPVSRLDWGNGTLTEIALPALDAASKDPAYLTVKITPASTRVAAPQAAPAPINLSQKKWLPSNFRLQIAGCSNACSRVRAIDAIALTASQAPGPLGATRMIQASPRVLETPNLSVATAEVDAGEFFTWYEDFLIKGGNTPDKEKTGTLEYLSSDLKTVFTLNFTGLGIFKFAPEKLQTSVQTIRRVKTGMYCDSIGFSYTLA
jgi:hypothetical protein